MAIKKNWYEIEAPIFFKGQIIGETPASDPKYLVGRTVSISLADLVQDAKRFYLKFNFRIVNVDGKAKTIFTGHDVTYERIYRMVQRHSRRIDCIQDAELADGARIRVKTILVIPKLVSTSVKDSVRKKMKSAVEKVLSSSTTENFMRMLIDGSLQSAIREECKKVYPVGPIEIRKSEVLRQPTKTVGIKESIDEIAKPRRRRARKTKETGDEAAENEGKEEPEEKPEGEIRDKNEKNEEEAAESDDQESAEQTEDG